MPPNLRLHCHNLLSKTRKYNCICHEHLQIKLDTHLKDETFFHFLKVLRNMKNLQKITIDFIGHSPVSTKILESFIMCICKHFPQLKEFSFKLAFSRRIEEIHINTLVNQLFKNLLFLEKLTIYTASDLSFENFRFLSRRMTGCCPKLRFLSTKFQNCDALIDRCLTTLVKHASHNLQNLQTLKMSFHNSQKFTYRGFLAFSKLISLKLQSLRQLSIEFNGCETFDHKALNVLTFEIFSNLTQLDSLEFVFPNCLKIKKQGFESMAKNMVYNQNKLKSFKINLSSRPQRSDEELEIIVKGIFQHLPSLESLSLCFNSTVISIQGIEAIEIYIIEKLRNLRHLKLEFEDNQYIRSHQIHFLAEKITKNLLKLEKLYLGFSSSDKLVIEELLKKNNLSHVKLELSQKYSW